MVLFHILFVLIEGGGMKFEYSNSKKYTMLLMIDLLQKCIRGLFVSLLKIKGFCKIIAVGRNVTILGKKKDLIVGKRVKIEDGVFLQTVSEHGVHLGNNVTICHGAEIRPSGFYGGNLGWGLKVGDYSSIGSNSYIGCSGKIVIGNNVMIGPHCTMIAENHNFSRTDIPMNKQGVSNKGIEIKDDVWIGANVTILDGVTVASGCVLAAGVVVTKSTEPNGVYAGVPARRIKERV